MHLAVDMLLEFFSLAIWIFRHLSAVFIGLPSRLLAKSEPKRTIPPVVDDVLLLSAVALSEKIRTRKLTAKSVMSSYVARVRQVNPIVNGVVEDRFASAMIDAMKVDRVISDGEFTNEELMTKFPLLGVPFSVKESIAVTGSSHNAGVKRAKPRRAKEDADVIKLLRAAGGIPFVITNTPELCLNWETYNKVTGRTLNPYDTNRSPGGSSGGEASLLASACSVVGIGSDIGGSLRLPAHFCGLWGHKPSPGLVEFNGHYPNSTDENLWKRIFSLGPMSRYSSDLPALLHVMTNDVSDALGLLKEVDFATLKIYYMIDNGGWMCRPTDGDIAAAIRKIVVHFRDVHNAQIQPMRPKYLNLIGMFCWMDMLSVEGTDDIFDKDPKGSVAAEFLRYVLGRSDHCFLAIFFVLIQRTLKSIKLDAIRALLNDVVEKFRKRLGNDGVVICPTFPSPACSHNQVSSKLTDMLYLIVFNYLGLPVTSCPVGFSVSGLPIGVQVAANQNCDRLTLAVAQEIEMVFGGWVPPDKVRVNPP